jgi:hypothetical protein
VEYKKSEEFAKASAQGKNSHGKKGHNHHLCQGGYTLAIPKCRKMEEDLLTQGIIPLVYEWPERVKNFYHGGKINSEDGTLELPPSLRAVTLKILKIIEDVKVGRLKVDREMDELTMALGNLEHLGRCRGYGVLLWTFRSRETLAPIEVAKEEESVKRSNVAKRLSKYLNNKKKA